MLLRDICGHQGANRCHTMSREECQRAVEFLEGIRSRRKKVIEEPVVEVVSLDPQIAAMQEQLRAWRERGIV
jgi:hypothetical protein